MTPTRSMAAPSSRWTTTTQIAVNSMIDGIPVADVGLPASTVVDTKRRLYCLCCLYVLLARSARQGKCCAARRRKDHADRELLNRTLKGSRQLIHVKPHLGSSDLSHLFAQGRVSAELLHSNTEFRKMARPAIVVERQCNYCTLTLLTMER